MARAAGLQVSLSARTAIPLDLDVACAPGELLALVGPSGAGKSTALRRIAGLAGLHRAERGAIRCGGATWFDAATRLDLPAHRRGRDPPRAWLHLRRATAALAILEAA